MNNNLMISSQLPRLPFFLIQEILFYCSPHELVRICQTSPSLALIIKSNSLAMNILDVHTASSARFFNSRQRNISWALMPSTQRIFTPCISNPAYMYEFCRIVKTAQKKLEEDSDLAGIQDHQVETLFIESAKSGSEFAFSSILNSGRFKALSSQAITKAATNSIQFTNLEIFKKIISSSKSHEVSLHVIERSLQILFEQSSDEIAASFISAIINSPEFEKIPPVILDRLVVNGSRSQKGKACKLLFLSEKAQQISDGAFGLVLKNFCKFGWSQRAELVFSAAIESSKFQEIPIGILEEVFCLSSSFGNVEIVKKLSSSKRFHEISDEVLEQMLSSALQYGPLNLRSSADLNLVLSKAITSELASHIYLILAVERFEKVPLENFIQFLKEAICVGNQEIFNALLNASQFKHVSSEDLLDLTRYCEFQNRMEMSSRIKDVCLMLKSI